MKKSHLLLLPAVLVFSLSICWAGVPKTTSGPEGESLRYANGRSELVIYQTLLGGTLGTILGDAIDRKDRCRWYENHEYCASRKIGRPLAGLLLGAGAGLGASLFLTRDGYIDAGRTMVINFSGEWGAINGLLLSLATNMKDNSNQELLIFSTGLGAMLGSAILTRDKTFYSGNVGLAKSGAMWGALIPYGIYLALEKNPQNDTASLVALVGGNLGLASVAYLAPRIDWNRRKAIWLDLGGIIGTGSGLGIGVLLDPDNDQAIAAGCVFGSLIGLSIATLLNQIHPKINAQKEKSSPINSLFWKNEKDFGLGFPFPQLTTRKMGERVFLETQVPLVSLRW
ncbi:MAG: hypothetical protein PHE84_10105 [bacterium]|nr:hypothetical protein [bacterium]